MFGLEHIKYKRKLTNAISDCFSSLKDDLGNIPVAIQNDAFINGAIVEICEHYLDEQQVHKVSSRALIRDAVFEEIYRRESVKVQSQVDVWLQQNNKVFSLGYQQLKAITHLDEKLQWLSKYAQQNFESAKNLML